MFSLSRCVQAVLAAAAAVLLWPLAGFGGEAARGAVVALYHFDEGKGEWAGDASDAENHGFLGRSPRSVVGKPSWRAEGKAGGALEFDGQDDVVVVPHHPSLVPCRGIEVEAWVWQKRRTPFARVVDKGSCFELYIREDGIPTFRYRGAEAHGVRGSKPVPLGRWAHLKATHDGRTMTLRLDGETVGRRPYAEPIPNQPLESGADLRIGNGRAARPFCGLIDEVKLVNLGFVLPVAEPFQSDADTVGLWHLDGDAKDAGPGGLDGEVLDAEAAAGKLGRALRFDGKARVRVPHHPSLDLQEELTIDCWVKQLARSPYARIVEKDDWTYGLWIQADGRADFFYKPPVHTSHTISEAALPLNRWVHIRAEFDGSETILYFDGKEVARTPVPEQKETIVKSDGGLSIGNRRVGDRGFIGLIDEVRLSRTVRRPRPPLSVRVVPYPSKEVWVVRVNARGTRGRAASVVGRVVAKATGRAVREFELTELKRGVGRIEVSAAGLAPGDYTVAADALDAAGAKVAAAEASVTVPARPVWLGANLGVSNDVLPPWTPMRAETGEDGRVHVSCWGRRHTFAGFPLPRQIRSAGSDLLAAPVQLVIRARGSGLKEIRSELDMVSAAKHEVRLAGTANVGTLELATQATMEYDGLIRFDLEVKPSKPTQVESAWLEIPLAARHATLMHRPGKWFDDPTCAGALPRDGWRAPSTAYLWLGDEERGLCWFAEDQAAWGLDPKRPGIEATRDGDVVRLRVWLVNATTRLAEPRSFTWASWPHPSSRGPRAGSGGDSAARAGQ